MFKSIVFSALAVCALVPVTGVAATGEALSDEQRSVMTVIMKMTASVQDGDIEGVMSTYEDEAIVMFEPGTSVSDQAAIRQIFSEMVALNPKVTYSGHEVIVAGDIAVHFAPWSMTVRTPDGGGPVQGGLSVAVLRRQSDGGWRIVIDNPYGDHLLTR